MTDLIIPMDEESFIKKEKLEHPYCVCGLPWHAQYIPVMGYIRVCDGCPLPVSFCVCGAIFDDPREHGHGFA